MGRVHLTAEVKGFHFVVLAALAALAVATPAAAEEFYEMLVTLDADSHRLEGQQWIRWTNSGDIPTTELWWHLYLNAFSNSSTTFMRGLDGGFLRRTGKVEDMAWGWTRITSMTLEDGTDLLASMEFVRPDDGNPGDFTVARVTLPEAVPPGASVDIETSFEAQLPKIIARTGFAGDFHLVGQWFPKLGVFEGSGGWNCHQFHANSEFFADFGGYRVTINVPNGWVVGATGMEITRMEVPNDPSRGLQVVYAAERVHDFAWTAAPESLMATVEDDFQPGRDIPPLWLKRASETLGLSAAELELPPTRLRVLIPQSQLELAPRFVNAARLAIAWYGLWYGPYPYPQLTVVSPPPTAGEAGGMEYPTFVTASGGRLLTVPPFRWLSRPEVVTIHEFGHQYFQGMLASNEFEQAWLDEGLNSYAETACMEAVVADGLAPDVRFGGFWTKKRLWFGLLRFPLTIDRHARDFRSRYRYFAASYSKTALALKTLEGLVGEQQFARAMRAYFERFRYRHPTGDDLFATFSDVAGEDLFWFFDQAIRSDASVDWSVLKVSQRSVSDVEGVSWEGDAWEVTRAPQEYGDETKRWVINVELGRTGDFIGPVEAELFYEDGSRERRTWDGVDRWVRWTIEGDRRLTRVVVDPDGVWAIETRRQDNYWAAEGSSKAACGALWWVSEALQLAALGLMPWS